MDRPDFLSSYADEGGVTTHSVTSDKQAVRKAKACLWETYLVCTHLRGYTDAARTAEFDMEVGCLTHWYYHILSLTWRWVV